MHFITKGQDKCCILMKDGKNHAVRDNSKFIIEVIPCHLTLRMLP